jgi:hypothetical protein
MGDQNLLDGQRGDDCVWLPDSIGQASDPPEIVILILKKG